MKPIILLLLLLVFSVCFAACSSDEPRSDEDCYYVRYTAIAEPDRTVNMNFTDENGNNTLIQSSRPDGKFEYSAGPVSKGFTADLVVSYFDGGPVSFLSIEVARGAEPFVLKEYGKDHYNLRYKIE